MKPKLFLFGALLIVQTASAQTRPDFRQFGNVVINANKAKLVNLHGKINAVTGGIVILDVYKNVLVYRGHNANSQQDVGAYSAGLIGGYSEDEYDRSVVVTNLPDFGNATIDKETSIKALRIGVFTLDGKPLEFYDCGKPYIPPPLTPEQLKAAQEAARIAEQQQKTKQFLAQSNAIRWLQPQATNGDASAQCSLGEHYLAGQGCQTNRALAIYWLTQAANQGDIEASNKLASLKQ